MSKKRKLAIAGATGFIGRWFIETYKDKYDIIALSRKKVNPSNSDVEWRMVDLFSISSSNKALEGVDYALYLVHSMQPSTRLNQSNFEDTDLLLADNFSRAAQNCMAAGSILNSIINELSVSTGTSPAVESSNKSALVS